MIIDCHGHFTTAPAALGAWRTRQKEALEGALLPDPAGPEISDDELRDAIVPNQLRLMDDRGIDLTLLSPRASFMEHHVGDLETSRQWARICNDLCARVTGLFPDRFAQIAMLPQSPGADPATNIPELERCVREHDIVGVNLNPDPSGGHWTSPPLTDPSWFPLYEALVAYDLPTMVHVSTSINPAFHTTGAHYLNADTATFMQLLEGDLFTRFPALKLVIPHGGGAIPYHWGRFRGLAMAMEKPPLEEHLLGNVYFDTCVYHQSGIDLLLDVVPTDNILFASEMIGAVRSVDPRTGHHFDDTARYLAASSLPEGTRTAIHEDNARRVYPRLDRRLRAQGR